MSVEAHTPTGEQYAAAMEYVEQQDYSNDRDLGRTDDEWRRDVFLGQLAEHVAASYLADELNLEPRLVDDGEDATIDIDLDGVGIDVKLRKLWTYEDPDLLVRAIRNPSADAYLMVEVGKTDTGYTANVSLWASTYDVYAHGKDFAPPGSKHDKLLVPRENLRDIATLPDYLELLGDSA